MNFANLEQTVKHTLSNYELDEAIKTDLVDDLSTVVEGITLQEGLRTNLEILHEYEEKYLKLIREHKEEIRFALALQEGVRYERSQFFTKILGEAAKTLDDAGIEGEVKLALLDQLIKSYTHSLDTSSKLTETKVINTQNEIRRKVEHIAADKNAELSDE